MQALLEVILPVFVVIGSGYAAVRLGIFSDADVEGLMRFTQGFAIPVLLVRAIADLDLAASFDPLLLLAFYTGALVSFGAGILGARLLFSRPWEDAIVIGFSCLFSNSVLLGLPIMERAYGADALAPNYAIIAVHAPFCYLVGVTAIESVRASGSGLAMTGRKIAGAMFHNALVIGILVGFAINLSGLTLPDVILDGMDLMIRAALPAALFGLGGILVGFRLEGNMGTILMITGCSLLLHPAVVWIMGSALSLPDAAFRSAIVTAAMAPGVNTYIFANIYGRARRVAASGVLVATAGSILTAWMWLALLP